MSNSTSNPWFGISMGLLGLIVGYGLSAIFPVMPTLSINAGPKETAQVAAPSPTPTAAPAPTPPAAEPADADDDPVLGDGDAPITLIEFSDFQCPFCRKFYEDSLPDIRAKYIDTGKVKLVYRDFPLSFHPAALPSAIALECAHEQGNDLAWAMHDAIFEEQAKQGQGTVQFTADDLKTWAKGITGLKQSTFASCLDSEKHKDEVEADTAAGSKAGIDGTPGFWILGPGGKSRQLIGAQPFTSFQQAFDSMLE